MFSFSDLINSIYDSISSNSLIQWVAKNPVYTTLCLMVVLILTLLWVFRDVEIPEDESLLSLSLRSSLILGVVMLFVLTVHNGTIIKEYETRGVVGGNAELFHRPASNDISGMMAALDSAQIVPVNINSNNAHADPVRNYPIS